MSLEKKEWSEAELENLPASKLQKRIPKSVENVFLFGAGASFGSDASHLYRQRKIPPLGKDLFMALHRDPRLESWNKLPNSIAEKFSSLSFEEAMDSFEGDEDWAKESFKRDQEISLFFSKFRPLASNLYWKLGKSISKHLKLQGNSLAAITLNYDRLLEESLMRNLVFTVVNGVTFYDDDLPDIKDDQLFEICYPHGACQFFLGQSWFSGEGNIVFGPEASAAQVAGANHLLKYDNIPKACEMKQIPIICRYQSSKRPSVKNYFIEAQQERCTELVMNAETITIIGVMCSHKIDTHLWGSLEKTDAFITYVEPTQDSQEVFREWGKSLGKIEGEDYKIIPKTFKDSFGFIKEINRLQ